MVDEIITGLARIKSLFVIARNSTFAFKGRTMGVKQVGQELGVRYVLQGSVRKAANRVRVTAQLVAAESGAHLWADRYDRPLGDIFGLQDEITLSVVAPSSRACVKRRSPRQTQASGQCTGRDDATALALGAFAIAMVEHDRATAFAAFEQALSVSPSSAFTLFLGCVALAYAGEVRRAIDWAERALRISPFDRLCFGAYHGLAVSHFLLGRYEGRECWASRCAVQPRF